MRVGIVDRDTLFRAELRNFLLSAGFAQISVASDLPESLGDMAVQDVWLLDEDVWCPWNEALLRRILRAAPHALIVSMIRPPDAIRPAEALAADPRVRHMVKTDFSRSLLPLLMEAGGGDTP